MLKTCENKSAKITKPYWKILETYGKIVFYCSSCFRLFPSCSFDCPSISFRFLFFSVQQSAKTKGKWKEPAQNTLKTLFLLCCVFFVIKNDEQKRNTEFWKHIFRKIKHFKTTWLREQLLNIVIVSPSFVYSYKSWIIPKHLNTWRISYSSFTPVSRSQSQV